MFVDHSLKHIVTAVLLLGAAAPVFAAPTIDGTFGDHAVIQRERPIVLRGTAKPAEPLTAIFANASHDIRADAAGRWRIVLPAMTAGGPYRLEVRGDDGSISASDDLMVGDVWLCSGQSNMEFPVRRVTNAEAELATIADAQLRLMKVPHQAAIDPAPHFAEPPRWVVSSPETAKDFAAACYFMARDLRASEKVAIGAIDASWGATPIRAWTDFERVKANGGADAAKIVDLYRKDRFAAVRSFGEQWGAWWRKQSGDVPGKEPWNAPQRLAWKPVPSVTYWDSWSPEFAAFNGAAWVRRQVELTPEEAGQSVTLSLGVIDDLDLTFINGVAVGSTNDWVTPRDYRIGPGILKAGSNEILVYVRDNYAQGGFQGPADRLKLRFADGHERPLGSGWEYALIASGIGQPPLAPWEGLAGVSTAYNAMIVPLGPLGLRGVAWYQGEADVGFLGYDKRLAAMMAGWREQFQYPELPFLIIALAGWGKPVSAPVDSGWARLIDEQRKAASADPAAALVVATDLGEQDDLHPPNKQEVGRRLALAARSVAYGDRGAPVGPLPISATRTANGIEVRFTSGLQVLGGSRPLGFELCGEGQASCRYVDATAGGNAVTIAEDRGATRVRYGWSDFPILNLYSGDLPVPPFELPIN